MFKMYLRRACGLVLTLFVAGSLAVSCYDDTELRNSINDLRSQLTQLQNLVGTLQNDDAVTGVTPNSDGSYTIKFKKSGDITIRNGKDGDKGEDGADGKDGSIVSVIKGEETYTFVFSDGTTIILPRYSELCVLTFEDADYKGPVNSANYWSSMIDAAQYGGSILYGTGCNWSDEYNTFLSGSVSAYDAATWSGGLSSGGIAISHYGNGELSGADYTRQLECYKADSDAVTGGAGADGSDNFAIVYDAGAWGSNPAALVMADKVARRVESVQVNNTTYVLNSLMNGDSYSSPMASDGFFKITATGYLGDEATGTSEFYLAHGGTFITDWTSWDLSGLGSVDKIVFKITGSPELYSEWGITAPAYFAIDNVTVKVYPD